QGRSPALGRSHQEKQNRGRLKSSALKPRGSVSAATHARAYLDAKADSCGPGLAELCRMGRSPGKIRPHSRKAKNMEAGMRQQIATLFAIAAGVGSVHSASAADIPTKAPVYRTPAAVVAYNWSGVYVGGNAGAALQRNCWK